jgi:hypothetical protein
MGYTTRTKQYRLVVRKDVCKPDDVELHLHEVDPREAVNVEKDQPEKVAELLT